MCKVELCPEFINKGLHYGIWVRVGNHFRIQSKKSLLVDEEYPDVKNIRLVMDNLNTHKEKLFYEAFSEEEAKRILDKIEFHYTPKHASWLNAAEIEINVMDIECTDRRIGDMEKLAYEVVAWTKRRNDDEKKINWEFTSENADEKLSKHYVP